MKKWILPIALVASGCASQPEKISTAYVSPMQYMQYDCNQLVYESARVNRRANELHASLKKTADDDEVQMGIGLVLFWPALFFLEGGDGATAHEYARLKGEREAIDQQAIQKRCALGPVPTNYAPPNQPTNNIVHPQASTHDPK